MNKVSLNQHELLNHQDEQVSFLIDFCDLYDKGRITIAKMIATVLSTLLYDSKSCKSVLGQLNKKSGNFLSTVIPFEQASLSTYS